jgi:tryptophan-rich sensory protein
MMILHILIPVLSAIVVNAIIYLKQWNSSSEEDVSRSNLLPPGWAIGLIWTFIFALLGYLHYTLTRDSFFSLASLAVVVLILFCLAYPFMTSGLQEKNAKVLNTTTLILVAIVMWIVPHSIQISWPLLPILVWASFVNMVDAIECSPSA